MTIILGIDPALTHTGWGLVSANAGKLSFVACGIIHTNAKQEMTHRLLHIHDHLKQVIALYKPAEAAIEETFVNKNSASSLKLGQARGAIMLTIATEQLPLSEYSANLVKKSVVGNGHADKTQVAMMVKTLLPLSSAEKHGADASDALAVAICHAHQRELNSVIRGKIA